MLVNRPKLIVHSGSYSVGCVLSFHSTVLNGLRLFYCVYRSKVFVTSIPSELPNVG